MANEKNSPKLAKAKQGAVGPPPPQDVNVSIVGGVSLEPSARPDTEDQAFWSIIRESTERLSYTNYAKFIDGLFCDPKTDKETEKLADRARRFRLPFADVDSYRFLKGATELFMMRSCGVRSDVPGGVLNESDFYQKLWDRDKNRLDLELLDGAGGPGALKQLWDEYLVPLEGAPNGARVLPYLAAVRANVRAFDLRFDDGTQKVGELCNYLLGERVLAPCLLELIWSYWHEIGELTGTMQAISMRFQNKRPRSGYDPLAEFELAPLQPLNNLLWGYVRDEQHRLPKPQRGREYIHEYGLRIGPARSPEFRPADSRTRFLEVFHQLLHKAVLFFKDEDDTTVVADAFPVLNQLRDVHLTLAEGGHNQFGDLPWTARQEMLMEQWLLARPEFDRFLPWRDSVVLPEPWMRRVETYRRLRDRTSRLASVRHYRDLATFGEQLLLSIRYPHWGDVHNPNQAANWARFWRQEIQWYIHAYQAVTGVDLSSGIVDVRQAEGRAARAAQPAALMGGAASRTGARPPQAQPNAPLRR